MSTNQEIVSEKSNTPKHACGLEKGVSWLYSTYLLKSRETLTVWFTDGLSHSPHELVHAVRLPVPLKHPPVVIDRTVLVHHRRDAKVVLHVTSC